MFSPHHRLCLFVCLLVGFLGTVTAFGADHPAELLPPSTVLYAEVSDPPALLEFVWDHPVATHLRGLPAYQQALEEPDAEEFLTVLGYLEDQLGMDWREAFRVGTAGGAALAIDARTEGAALLVRAADAAKLDELKETFLRLAREDAEQKGEDVPFREDDYRGIPVYLADGGGFATYERWLVLVNEADFGREILDALLDSRDDSLAGQENFQQAREATDGGPLVWVYANISMVREAGAAEDVFNGKADDPVGELLFGGVLEVLQRTPFASVALTGDQHRLGVKFSVPFERSWITEERSHYFGPRGAGAAPPVLNVPNTLFTLAAYRDVSEMWLRADDLFDENVNNELAEADSNLSTLFAGKDFGEDILGSLSPQLQIVAARQEFPTGRPVPAIKLPAFALVAPMKNPEVTAKELRRVFQNLIGFLNVVGATEGNPQLELDVKSLDSGELITAAFVPEAGEVSGSEASDGGAKIYFNFSPSVAFAGDRMIIASTAGLARDLATAEEVAVQEGDSIVNLSAELSAGVLQAVLNDNVSHLMSQNMLKKGHTHDEADAEVNTLLDLLGLLKGAALTLTTNEHVLNLEMEIQWAE